MPRRGHSLMAERQFARRRSAGIAGKDTLDALCAENGWYSPFRQKVLNAATRGPERQRVWSRLVWPLRLLSPQPEPVYPMRPNWPGISLRLRVPFSVRWIGVPVKGPYRKRLPQPAVGPAAPFQPFRQKRNRKLS